MLRGLFRLVLIFLVIYIAYFLFRVYRSLTQPRKKPDAPRQIQGEMVKDDVCNTYIPKDEAIREIRDGREVFFCSEECRRKSRAR
ncbi:MAG: PP0621 family protein [Acidobacteriota bacterium]